jgi:hypothetical protein
VQFFSGRVAWRGILVTGFVGPCGHPRRASCRKRPRQQSLPGAQIHRRAVPDLHDFGCSAPILLCVSGHGEILRKLLAANIEWRRAADL